MIKFSIITVVHNGQHCMDKTISSLLEQTYKAFEYIIVDGGSSDNTLEVCEKYRDIVDKVISETDRGIYDAMNKGIDNANGDYIFFLNCDDCLYNNLVLEKVAGVIQSNNFPDFIYGDSFDIFENSSRLFYKKARSHRFIWYGMFTHHQSMFYSLKAVKSLSMYYRTDLLVASDYDFTARFLKETSVAVQMQMPISVFKNGGMSSKNAILSLEESIQVKRDVFKMPLIMLWIFRLYYFGILHPLRFKFLKLFLALRHKKGNGHEM